MSALGAFFSDRARDLRVWQTLFVGAAIAIPVTNQMTARTCLQEERFFAMDGRIGQIRHLDQPSGRSASQF